MEIATRRFLHDIIADLLSLDGSKVIWSNQDGVKQDAPLVTLMTYSHQAEAMEDHLTTAGAGVLDIKTPTAFVLEVRFFGKKRTYPADILDNLIRQLERPSVVDRCFANGVAFLFADPVQDITTTLENNQQFEPAAAVDIHCRYTASTADDVGYISGVNGIDPGTGQPTSRLIYGHISKDGGVTDLDHSIPVNITI